MRRLLLDFTAWAVVACSAKSLSDVGPSDDPNDYQVDTMNILFICGGAFHGLEKRGETA